MTAFAFDNAGDLLTFVRKHLILSKKTLKDIHKETGLPYVWLVPFTKGKIRNPSVNRVEFLYTYLTSKQLALGEDLNAF